MINNSMAIELEFSTRVYLADQLIEDGEVNPILDFDGMRYSIEINNGTRMLEWTPFDLTSQLIIGTKIYTYPYAAHSILLEALRGPSSQAYHRVATASESVFPNFPVPLDMGTVTP